MKKTIFLISVLIIILLISACSLSPVITSSTTDQSSNDLEPEVSVNEPVGEDPDSSEDLHAESVFGPGTFTMDIPDGWMVVSDKIVDEETGRSYQIYLLAPDQGYMEGPGASKVIVASTEEWNTMDLIQKQCSTCPDNGFEVVTLDDTSALKTEIGGGGVPFMLTWYFVEHNGNLIGIAIHDPENLEPLTDVIESIQLQ